MLTKEQQKEIAIKRLEQLQIYKPYINEFKKHGVVTMFENFGGFYATVDNGEEELANYIAKFEQDSDYLVYAVTHEITDFGECYSLLCVSTYEEDETPELDYSSGVYYPWVWVWNKDDDNCSEFGTIGVQSMGGGIRRCY